MKSSGWLRKDYTTSKTGRLKLKGVIEKNDLSKYRDRIS